MAGSFTALPHDALHADGLVHNVHFVQNFEGRTMQSWQAAEAKQNFGRLIDAAQAGPQMLLRHSEPVGVVLSMEHYARLKAQADAEFANFLLSSPLEEHDFDGGVGMNLSDEPVG